MPTFSVIITEKGGAERREAFDRAEINVGRVQGNDLMLPKGNVSKRHARLLYRDGRFIVTDLKSTNGTYVNGRKITQATIVREGDKIYIGDFVLRIESATPGSTGTSDVPQADEAREPRDPTPPPADPPSSSSDKSLARALSPRIESKSEPSRSGTGSHEIVSHFPLEHDPDDSVQQYAVPGPPRVPSTPRALGTKSQPVPAAQASPSQLPPRQPSAPGIDPIRLPAPPGGYEGTAREARIAPPQPAFDPATPRPAQAQPSPTPAWNAPPTATPGANALPLDDSTAARPAVSFLDLPPTPPPRIPEPSPPPPTPPIDDPSTGTRDMLRSGGRRALIPTPDRADPSAWQAARNALHALIQRVVTSVRLPGLEHGDRPDEATSAEVERAANEIAAAMKAAGELPSDWAPEKLATAARREILELGPIGALLEDEDVTEVNVMRHDHVVAILGRRQVTVDLAFSSEGALALAIRRLCALAGRPQATQELIIERRLPRGTRMFAVIPPATEQGHVLVLRKPQRADLALEDLVRSGTISRAMATLLAHAVAGRANILVTGSVGAGTTSLLGALATAGDTDDRVIVLEEADELILNQPHTVSMVLGDTAETGARAVQAAARVHPDRLVVGAFAGRVAAELVDVIGDGLDGVLAAARAPTLRQALARLPADLAASRPGVAVETTREWLASAFDLAIEIARLSDGRHRVMRIAELTTDGARVGSRDIFTFIVERTAAGGAVEGTFTPSGVVPAVVEDLLARGVGVDTSMFRRS